MNKWCLGIVGILSVCAAQAQTYPVALDTENAVEAPPSSIDLLKRSVSNMNAASQAQNTPLKQQAQAAQVAGTQPAKTAAAAPTTSAPTKSTVLEMPLSSGQVVQTTVSQPRSTAVLRKAKKPEPTALEKDIENNNALTDSSKKVSSNTASAVAATTPETASASTQTEENSAQASEAVAQEELDYATRIMQQAKQDSQNGRFIPQAASRTAQEIPSAAPVSARPYNPNEYRPGVEWQRTNSTHFVIYNQKRNGGIGSSNMGMIFETAYDTLRRNIPWMMSNKVRVFVYQDHDNYLKYEPNAKAWTRALAYPTRGEIVVYDEPGKQQELKEVFTHELVHIFTQQFFDKYKTGRLMTPAWLDEGLAVYMEDQAYNGIKGGPWANDLKTLNFQRDPQSQVASFGSTSMFGSSRSGGIAKKFTAKSTGKPLYFMPFDQFMQDSSLQLMESQNRTQDWYFQAYAMVRFLLNPAGSSSPSNRMQFEQFTRLIAQGEQVRDPNTGFVVQGRDGKPLYKPYSVEKALGRAFRYSNASNFEDNFWRWAENQR